MSASCAVHLGRSAHSRNPVIVRGGSGSVPIKMFVGTYHQRQRWQKQQR